MPFLRDEGPPIPPASIQKLREALPVEYGWQTVNETGREVLVVRVPKAKPDYLHDLAEVAFYVGLETVRNTKDVLLVGHEKTARLEPQLLRDHIRAQGREDANVVEHLRRSLDRQYGHTFVRSPSNHEHNAFAIRVPKETVAQFTPEDVNAIRQIVASLRARVLECQYAYIVANADHERLGRRVLMELIGDEAAAPAAVDATPAPLAPTPAPAAPMPATPAAPAPTAPTVAPPARTPFPRADPTVPLPPAPTPVPAAAPTPVAPPAPPPAAAPQASAPTRPPEAPTPATADVEEHDEYEIVSKPRAAVPPPAPTAAPEAPSAPTADVEAHEEYEIVSKPRAAAPAPKPTPLPTTGAPASAAPHDEYEIVSKPKEATPEPAPAPTHEPEPERTVVHADKEFEVFVSKPKPRPADSAPAITPPGKGGFMAALNAGTGPAPAKTKEYEIIGRTTVTSDPSIAARLRLPGAHAPAALPPVAAPTPVPVQHAPPPTYAAAPPPAPAYVPPPAPAPAPAPPPVAAPTPARATYEPTTAVPPRVPTTPTLPAADNGAPIVPRVAPAAPELILAQRFREVGYEIVEGLRAQGTVFAFAAHKPNGRRVLVKRAATFAPEEAASLAQLVAALGADVALVVADDVKAGTRLATWGTRIEVVTPADVPSLAF